LPPAGRKRKDPRGAAERRLLFVHPSLDLQRLGGPPYTGDWRSGNYILGIGRTSDHVTDPSRRSEYKSPLDILTP
jgi:hypothetical protein